MNAYTINFEQLITITDDAFYQLCKSNPEIKFERNQRGELIIMSPTGGETGRKNVDLIGQFWLWNRQSKLGVVFESSTCFKLPSGVLRSPDVAWIAQSRWNTLSQAEKEKFPPLAPDFVLELLSLSDNLKETQAKMQEYLDNGVKLGWLINPVSKQVEIYRPNQAKEILNNPSSLSGENLLSGLNIDLLGVWE